MGLSWSEWNHGASSVTLSEIWGWRRETDWKPHRGQRTSSVSPHQQVAVKHLLLFDTRQKTGRWGERRRPAASARSFSRFHLKVSTELTLIGAQLILGLAPEEVFCCSPRCSRCWLRMMSNWCVGGPDKPENKETGKQNSGNFPSLNAGFFIPPDSLQECRSWEGKIRVLSLTGDIKEAATAVWLSAQMPVQNLIWRPSAGTWGLNNWNATKTKPRCPARLITAPGRPEFFIRDSKAPRRPNGFSGTTVGWKDGEKILLVKK